MSLLPMAIRVLVGAICVYLSLSCVAQETTIAHVSDQNGPIAISGTMVFRDDGSETTPYSFKIKAYAKNVSRRAVLFFKVEFPLSSDTSPEPAPQEYEHDYFFSPHALDPTSSVDFEISLDHYGSRVAGSSSPHLLATANLLFVQFTDGTTWGDDPDLMKDIVRARNLTVYELKVLKDTFEKSGDEGFAAELKRTGYSAPALSALQHVYNEGGLDEAKTTAWSMIESAKRHEREIQSSRLSGTLLDFPLRK